jgi:hypothetical protein
VACIGWFSGWPISTAGRGNGFREESALQQGVGLAAGASSSAARHFAIDRRLLGRFTEVDEHHVGLCLAERTLSLRPMRARRAAMVKSIAQHGTGDLVSRAMTW